MCERETETLKPQEKVLDGIRRHWIEIMELEKLAAK